MFNLKRKVISLAILVVHPDNRASPMEDDIHVATKWMIEFERAKRRGVKLIMGKDGRRYELREAKQTDVSIIHHDDPTVAWNDGWLRHFDANQWTGFMVRPADPAVRKKHLEDRLAAIEARKLIDPDLAEETEEAVKVLSVLTTTDQAS